MVSMNRDSTVWVMATKKVFSVAWGKSARLVVNRVTKLLLIQRLGKKRKG